MLEPVQDCPRDLLNGVHCIAGAVGSWRVRQFGREKAAVGEHPVGQSLSVCVFGEDGSQEHAENDFKAENAAGVTLNAFPVFHCRSLRAGVDACTITERGGPSSPSREVLPVRTP